MVEWFAVSPGIEADEVEGCGVEAQVGGVHCGRSAHAAQACPGAAHALEADFVFQAKGNQPRLFAALDELDWGAVPIGHEQTVRGHGRSVRRTMQVLPAPGDLPFPHVSQIFLCERWAGRAIHRPFDLLGLPHGS